MAASLHGFLEPRLCQWAGGFQSGWSVFQTIDFRTSLPLVAQLVKNLPAI